MGGGAAQIQESENCEVYSRSQVPTLRRYARKDGLKKSKVQVSSRAGPGSTGPRNASWNGRSHPNSAPAKGTGTKGFGEGLLCPDNGRPGLCSQEQPSALPFPLPQHKQACPLGSRFHGKCERTPPPEPGTLSSGFINEGELGSSF